MHHAQVDGDKQLKEDQDHAATHDPEETAIVLTTNACIQIEAMMIKVIHAFVADSAVFGLWFDIDSTNRTQ